MATDAAAFDYGSGKIPPGALFVAADEPLLVFPSVAAAERDLEATDVENDVYRAAYGPNGEPYRVGSHGNRVIIEATGEASRPDELRRLLLRYLEARGGTAEPKAALGDVVAIVWAIESGFRQRRVTYRDRFKTRMPAWGWIAVSGLVAAFILLLGLGVPG